MKLTGAQIISECLERENVEYIFGYQGAVVIPVINEMTNKGFKFILGRHEQGSIHEADGYARATGKPGVVLATSGPGATNLVTGLATAHMDSTPLVAFTGQVATNMIGNDAFQEVDIIGITRSITKHNFLVKDIKDLARIIKEAFYIATTGRPGPVLIDLPVDIVNAETEFIYPENVDIRSYKPNITGHPNQIKKAATLISQSKKPVIYAGGGVILSDAAQELRDLVKKTGIPITTTLLGLGSFPETEELALEMLGMHGTYYANHAVNQSDLLIAIGARFDDRVTGNIEKFIPNAKVIHIDIDPASVSKTVVVDIPIVGDCKQVLQELNKHVETPEIEEWVNHVKEMKGKHPLSYKKTPENLKPQQVIEELYNHSNRDTIITTDVGQHQMWAAQFYKFTEPRSFLSSGGLGTMGYGLPAAIGAQLGMPEKKVICLTSDGSIQMNIQELIVAVKLKLPIIIAILNNGYLGMIRQWQDIFCEKNYTCSNISDAPDFIKLAESYGARGIAIENPEDLTNGIKEALAIKDRPVVIDFRVYEEENVYPMMPAGKSFKDIILGD